MKIQKRNARLRWYMRFDQLTNIRAYAQVPDDDHFYICGDYKTAETESSVSALTDAEEAYSAAIIRMGDDAEIKWYITVAGTNPTAGKQNQDRCFGISYNRDDFVVSALL